MNKKIIYVVIVVAALCLAYPGFAWLIGMQVQAATVKREQQLADRFPGTLTLISRQYHRGIYGATEELTYGLGASALRALKVLPIPSNVGALRLTIHNTIHHGPLPQFRTIGLATIDTQVELPPELSAQVRALLGGEPAIQLRSRLGWLGGATTELTSAAYQGRLADGTQISWHGVDATSSINGSLSANSIDWNVTDFGISSARIHSQVDGVHVSADWKPVFDVLYTGPFSMHVKAVNWQSAAASRPTLLQGVSIDGQGSADGDYYKYALQFGADTVQTASFTVTQAAYDISFEHWYGPTLAAITRDMRAAQINAGALGQPAAALEALQKNAVELLLHEPVVNIARIGFTMPEGELRFSAKASAPGLTREELEGGALQAVLMQHLNVVADLHIDAALAARLMSGSGQKEALSARIDALEHQGYIKREGTALTAHLTFAGGKLSVNGQPYPPGPAQ